MSWFRSHRAQFRLGLRITVAGLLAYVLCLLFGLQTYQAVLTAVIVMQASAGASLKAMMERFLGSLGGALWAGAILLALQPHDAWSTGMALAIALAPLGLLTASRPVYRAAPTTAVILMLTPASAAGPLAPAVQRMLGVGLGSVVAVVVALLVLPARTRGAFAEAVGRVVNRMAELASILLKGLTEAGDPEKIQNLHDDIRRSMNQAEAAAEEVLRESATILTAGPDPLPICRALRRLLNDLAMIGRATSEQLPDAIRMQLSAPVAAIGSAIATFLLGCVEAISRQQPAPSLEQCEKELAHFASILAEMRQSGLHTQLPDETVGRIFGLSFGLEQMHGNLLDFADRIREMAGIGK